MVTKEKSEYYHFDRKEMIPFIPQNYSKVLEIGCGSGGFRDNLSLEHEYWGIEPVESIAKSAKNNLSKVLAGSYEERYDDLPDDYFDLIICNDVIEHMVDHDQFLQSIKSKMKENAYIVASIPNVRYIKNIFELLILKDWRYKEGGILDNTHLRFFTKKSIIRTVTNNGYIVDKISGINPGGYGKGKIFKRFFYYVAMAIFGSDVQYLQHGIRIHIKNN